MTESIELLNKIMEKINEILTRLDKIEEKINIKIEQDENGFKFKCNMCNYTYFIDSDDYYYKSVFSIICRDCYLDSPDKMNYTLIIKNN